MLYCHCSNLHTSLFALLDSLGSEAFAMFHLHHMQGVLYSHRSNFLHAFVVVMPDSLDLSSASCVLAVVPMFHVSLAWLLLRGIGWRCLTRWTSALAAACSPADALHRSLHCPPGQQLGLGARCADGGGAPGAAR